MPLSAHTSDLARRQERLSWLLLAAAVGCFWLLAFPGAKGGLTPHGWGQHALALREVAFLGARPYEGNFFYLEGHVPLLSAAPWLKLAMRMGWGLWGLTLYSRLLLTLAALLLVASARAAGLRGLVAGLVPVAFLFHPFTLDLAMGYEGMADALFYLSVAGFGLLRGSGPLVALGAVLAATCRGGALPHGVLLSLAFLLLYPKRWWAWLATATLTVAAVLGPVWINDPTRLSWYLGVVRYHLTRVFHNDRLWLVGVHGLMAGLPALGALAAGWVIYLRGERKNLWSLLLCFGLGPLAAVVLFFYGHLPQETKLAPTLLFLLLGTLVLWQQAAPHTAGQTPRGDDALPPEQAAGPPLASPPPSLPPTPLKNPGLGAWLGVAAVAAHLALAVRWQVDRWPRAVSLRPVAGELARQKPGTTLYGDMDLTAQAVYGLPGLALWQHFPNYDVSLFASVVEREVFLKALQKNPPDFFLLDLKDPTALHRSQSVVQWLSASYTPTAANRRGSLVLLRHKKRY